MTGAVALVPKRVLLVDDDPGLQRLWRMSLEQTGWQVRVAGSLAEARTAVLEDGRPDVVIADIRLPNGDGRHLREELHGVPFVIVTGFADDYDDPLVLAKPFSVSRLVTAVQHALGEQEEP